MSSSATRQSSSQTMIESILASVGVKINGDRPFDIRVVDENAYLRVLKDGLLGAGEGYMSGEWDCDRLDELAFRVAQIDFEEIIRNKRLLLRNTWELLRTRFKSVDPFEIGRCHYDLGNDLFEVMLDKRMVYSCGYWKNAESLDQAQEHKLELICQKVRLKRGMKVLDIGGGWGSFAKYAAQNYGAFVVNITVSQEQVELANRLCQGLSVENRLQDYRQVNEEFDAIVSVGMFEHVCCENYRAYMQVAHKNLKDDGLFLLHTIGASAPVPRQNTWLTKYIFPNSETPTMEQIIGATQDLFVIEDWHNFGADYDKTLMAWFDNFDRHWDQLKSRYDDTFYRMWKFYLLGCAGAFRARGMHLWQIVFSKHGVPGGYQSVR